MERQTYKTDVWLPHGGIVGYLNAALQPAGSCSGLPERIWAQDSWEWSLTLYGDDGETAFDCESATVAAYISLDADGASRTALGTASVGGTNHNVITVEVAAGSISETLWNKACRVMVEVSDAGYQTTIWQTTYPMAVSGITVDTPDYYIVGAGSAVCNVGVYYVGTSTSEGTDYITWQSDDGDVVLQRFDYMGIFVGWLITYLSADYYENTSTDLTPPASGWTVHDGAGPAPTISAA